MSNEEPDYLTWSSSKPEPEPVEPEPQQVPDGYMPPTSDGSGFVHVHGLYKQTGVFDEISFDVAALSGDQRRTVSFRLTELNVVHRVEGDQLIAKTDSASAVQGQIEAIVLAALPAEPAADTRWDDALRAEPVIEAPDEVDTRDTFETPSDWLAPAPIETAPVVDEPVVPRDEPEEIVAAASSDIDAVIEATVADEEEDADDDEIVFDLASLSSEERRHLSMRLTGAGIAHIWEVATDLVVAVKDAPAIESFIQEVQNPDGFGDEEIIEFESDEDVDDEEVYAAMSNLYVAADKLMQRPADPSSRTAFYDATDDVDGLPAPFGFDPRVWAQVQELANSIADAMDAEADDDSVAGDARTLRQLLVNYV